MGRDEVTAAKNRGHGAPTPGGSSQPRAPRLAPDVATCPEPKPRRDGRCARAGCAKKVVRSKAVRRYAGDQIDREPFCSTECCRRYHGCELASNVGVDDEVIEARKRGGREARQLFALATGGRLT